MADTTVTIIGNLTDDPELRFTAGGIPVANMNVAVTPRVRNGDQWEDGDTSFFRVTVWREYAEHVAESLEKGQRVVVIGTLAVKRWESDDGTQRSAPEITASEVAPSLKWATASVERIRRADAGNDRKPASRNSKRSSSRATANTRKGKETVPTSGGNFDDNPPF
jgi:single-strand DNA-binding protein